MTQSSESSGPDYKAFPDQNGHFGRFGGRFVSETLMAALDELDVMYRRLKDDPQFQADFDYDLAHYVGRPSPLYLAERWTKQLGGARIWLKREDLNHTGAHKVNNTIGQALLAKHMGKKRVIAETGAGQHGVACGCTCSPRCRCGRSTCFWAPPCGCSSSITRTPPPWRYSPARPGPSRSCPDSSPSTCRPASPVWWWRRRWRRR